MTVQIKIVGIHRLSVNDALVAEQTDILYGDHPQAEDIAQIRQQLESTVLVEVFVKNADAKFDVSDFTQRKPGLSRDNWEVAWAEAFLSTDGESMLCDRWDPLPAGHQSFRVAFFIHHWVVGSPLGTSYGDLATDSPTEMPERLQRLVPYELLD